MSSDVFVGGADKPVYPSEMDLLDEPMSPQALEVVLADDSKLVVNPYHTVSVKPLNEIRVDTHFNYLIGHIDKIGEFVKELSLVAHQIQSYPQLSNSVVIGELDGLTDYSTAPAVYFLEYIARWQNLRREINESYKLSELKGASNAVLENMPAMRDFLSISERVEIACINFNSNLSLLPNKDAQEVERVATMILRSAENLERIHKLKDELKNLLPEQLEAMTLLINGIAQKEA